MSAISAGPSADHLLTQIRALLGQYLAMGSDTPVAPEAMQLADAIDQITGGGDQLSPAGGPPPGPGDQAPLTSGGSAMPDMTGGMDLSQQQSAGHKDFKSASQAAKGDITALLQGKKKSKGK